MPRFMIAIALSLVAAGCQSVPQPPRGVRFSGGDGLTMKTAVVIKGSNDAEVTHAEYPWLKEHYPGSRPTNQELINDHGRAYDGMTITTAEGKELTIFFDITSGFGKW